MEQINNTNNQLTDDTFMECYNAGEYNKDQRLISIKNTLSFTNFWLGIIGIYFLIQTVKEIICFFLLYSSGIQITEIIKLLAK